VELARAYAETAARRQRNGTRFATSASIKAFNNIRKCSLASQRAISLSPSSYNDLLSLADFTMTQSTRSTHVLRQQQKLLAAFYLFLGAIRSAPLEPSPLNFQRAAFAIISLVVSLGVTETFGDEGTPSSGQPIFHHYYGLAGSLLESALRRAPAIASAQHVYSMGRAQLSDDQLVVAIHRKPTTAYESLETRETPALPLEGSSSAVAGASDGGGGAAFRRSASFGENTSLCRFVDIVHVENLTQDDPLWFYPSFEVGLPGSGCISPRTRKKLNLPKRKCSHDHRALDPRLGVGSGFSGSEDNTSGEESGSEFSDSDSAASANLQSAPSRRSLHVYEKQCYYKNPQLLEQVHNLQSPEVKTCLTGKYAGVCVVCVCVFLFFAR
jgi:hypothetical protein